MIAASFSRVLRRRVWTAGGIDTLAGETLTALTKISQLFEKQKFTFPDNRVAWGQYLDSNHFSRSQWGFFGTSAALQTLAVRARDAGHAPSKDSLLARAVEMPTNREAAKEAFEEKHVKMDFDNVVKLAFIADALCLDHEDDVPDSLTPAIVDELIDLAVANERWCSRLPEDSDYGSKDQDFPTALVVSVLRRYERFRGIPLWDGSRRWLANRILKDGSFREQRALLALSGLALLRHPNDPEDPPERVSEALELCETELTRWAREQGRRLVLNRPVFHGFSIGPYNDYVFLHPELLTAIFMLRRGAPADSRRFILEVVHGVWESVDRRDAFMGQDGMITCVDQLWATRLIRDFQRAKANRGVEQLIPRADAYLVAQGWKAKVGWILVLFAVAAGISVLAGGWAGLAAFGVGAILLIADWIRGK